MTHAAHTDSKTRDDKARESNSHQPHGEGGQGGGAGAYVRLAIMAALSFAVMYALMYAMVYRLADIHPNLNQLYMAALMAAPMVAIELALMRSMYGDARLNIAALAVSAIVFAGALVGIRQQTAIGDAEFLRSMIPHHSGAILMCREARLSEPDIRQLCDSIIAGQQAEIDRMEAMLARH
jgi:hypothetical protein